MIRSIMRLSPLDDQYEQELLEKFANVSRGVVLAVLAAAVVQGLLAGVGYYFALNAGAPIFLLTAMTMIGAVVPFVGAAGVWIPTCLWIYFYQERIVGGVVEQGDHVAAIRRVLDCGTWVPPALADSVAALPADPADSDLAARLASLTEQQYRVMVLLAEGLLNKQIADRLAIQERTVKAHVTAIFEKLGVRNRTQASGVLKALELGEPARVV